MSQVDVAANNVQFFFIQFDEEILAVRIMKCNNQYNDTKYYNENSVYKHKNECKNGLNV
jgi:hypothetical protein